MNHESAGSNPAPATDRFEISSSLYCLVQIENSWPWTRPRISNPDIALLRLLRIDPFGLVPMVRWFGNQKSVFFHDTSIPKRLPQAVVWGSGSSVDSNSGFQTLYHSDELSGVNNRDSGTVDTVPWSNGTTPARHAGSGGSTPPGTIADFLERHHVTEVNSGCWSNGKISGLHPEDRGSNPRRSTSFTIYMEAQFALAGHW